MKAGTNTLSIQLAEMEPEGGITQISLRNANRLVRALGKPDVVKLQHDQEHDEQYVVATWNSPKPHSFRFSGFSWGYGGEGPHGLLTFLNDVLGMVIPFTIEEIAAWDNEHATIGFWMKGISYREG